MMSQREYAKFGELIGMAFQIKDDLFDYSEEAIENPPDRYKRTKNDFTIHVLNTCNKRKKALIKFHKKP
jgi:octaprenyl-diphosphate synthase